MTQPQPPQHQPRRPWITDEMIDNWTMYHPPSGGKIALHQAVRETFNDLLKWLNTNLPEGPDKTNALMQARHAMNAANTCIACNPLDPTLEARWSIPSGTYADNTGATQVLPRYEPEDHG